VDRGWSPDVYEEWLGAMLSATLLGTGTAAAYLR
jgi:hypothetical protein